MKNSRLGFTLVELLVVIAIIGILVGLLLPAIGSAIENARRAECSTKVRALAQAAIMYESAKGSYPPYIKNYGYFGGGSDPADPGAAGNFGGAVPAHGKIGGFGVSLLPYLDQQAVFETWSEDRYPIISDGSGSVLASFGVAGTGFSQQAAASIPPFQCPSDANLGVSSNLGLNSYVSNNGMSFMQRDNTGTYVRIIPTADANDKANGASGRGFAFKSNGVKVGLSEKLSASDVKDGLSQTVLYSENVQAAGWHRAGFMDGYNTDSAVASMNQVNLLGDIENTVNFNAIEAAKYSNGFVWHFEDVDAGQSYLHSWNFDGTQVQEVVPPNVGNTTARSIYPRHKINAGGQASESLNVETITLSNCFYLSRPSSFHAAGVNVSFADGTTKFVADTIDYRVYQAIMTPRGKASRVPFREFVLTDQLP